MKKFFTKNEISKTKRQISWSVCWSILSCNEKFLCELSSIHKHILQLSYFFIWTICALIILIFRPQRRISKYYRRVCAHRWCCVCTYFSDGGKQCIRKARMLKLSGTLVRNNWDAKSQVSILSLWKQVSNPWESMLGVTVFTECEIFSFYLWQVQQPRRR